MRDGHTDGQRRKTTHFQNLLDVDGGDESFALAVKLMETLLVPVTDFRPFISFNSYFLTYERQETDKACR